jgi:hypothetical protein
MTDREVIKEEIKRLKTLVNSNESYGCGFNDALLMVDGFIDNLQDEHKLDSFDAIMEVVNRHRPYEPSDFIPESFIPDLDE